ncbi:hypothetical protein ACJ73_03663 [Blastomyces percursus]|uniref:carbonic anhydrase n=1 Tax=Blastomyces percursus TaxID=1658174 RepID=A0A1J9RBC7_9EURO|nr:hypothetical protein ACJ73_03663 [Blastomyces percursus]
MDDHKRIELPNFGYGPFDGPTNWHRLSERNKLCATGHQQSPIDVDDAVSWVPPGFLTMHIPIQNVTFLNLNTTLEVALWGSTKINCREFLLQQFHFHSPGEHTIYGEPFLAEVHLVHRGKRNPKELAVVALMVQVSAKHSIASLDKVIGESGRISKPGDEITIPSLNMTDITSVVNKHSLFTYEGSLTTPPCTEGVTFFIVSNPIPMDVTVIHYLKSTMGYNARFRQNNNATQPNVLAAACESIPAEVRCNATKQPAMLATSSVHWP